MKKQKIEVHYLNEDKSMDIAELIRNKHFGRVKTLIPLEALKHPIYIKPPYAHKGLSLLGYTAHRGACELINYFLDGGADIEITNPADGFTPLMTAIRFGQEECCRLLLDRGANAEIRVGTRLSSISLVDYAKADIGWSPISLTDHEKDSNVCIASLLNNNLVTKRLSGVISRGLTSNSDWSVFLIEGLSDPRLFIIVSHFAYQ